MKRIIYYLAVITLFYSGVSFSQQTADEIAKKVANPVASMISVPFQFNFAFNINGSGVEENGYKMITNIQPILPIPLTKGINLINRIIIPVQTQKDVTAWNQKESGLGDILYTAFISPADSKVIFGIGPAFSIPSSTNDFLGTKKLSVGPELAVLGQPGQWTFGGLVNQLWSIAGDKNRPDVNAAYFQPFVSYRFAGGFSLGLSSENTYDWKSKQLLSGLASISISQVMKFGNKQMASIMVSPLIYYANANVRKPEWGVRTSISLIFPE
jgi:hypothetical protein